MTFDTSNLAFTEYRDPGESIQFTEYIRPELPLYLKFNINDYFTYDEYMALYINKYSKLFNGHINDVEKNSSMIDISDINKKEAVINFAKLNFVYFKKIINEGIQFLSAVLLKYITLIDLKMKMLKPREHYFLKDGVIMDSEFFKKISEGST